MINSSTTHAKISAAALRLAAQGGWAHVTLEAVAKSVKIPVAKIKKDFTAPTDFISLIGEEIDREAIKKAGAVSGTPHDILFDLLMSRFDVMQNHRKAILSMADAAKHDRLLACALARATLDGIYRIIDAAALQNPPRPVLAAGIAAIYGWAFWIWQKDQSADMGKTMAALDRCLRLAGKALRLVTPRS